MRIMRDKYCSMVSCDLLHPSSSQQSCLSKRHQCCLGLLNHEVHTVCLDRCKIPMKDVTGTSSGGVRSIHSSLSRCSYCLTLLSHTFLLELSQKTVTLHMQQLLGVGMRGLLCNPRVLLHCHPFPSNLSWINSMFTPKIKAFQPEW